MAFQRRLQSNYRENDFGVAGAQLEAQVNVYLDGTGAFFDVSGPIAGSALAFPWSNETNNRCLAPTNRALTFKDNIFWLQSNKIFKLDYVKTPRKGNTGVGFVFQDWIFDYQFQLGSGNKPLYPGLYLANTSTGPKIITAYNAPSIGSTVWRGVKYTPSDNKNGTWSETANFNIAGAECIPEHGAVRAEMEWNNKLYWLPTNTGVLEYNPETNNIRSYNLPYGSLHKAPDDLFPFQGRMWHAGRMDSNRTLQISRFDDGYGFRPVLAITGVMTLASPNYETRINCFPDIFNPNVVHFFFQAANIGDIVNAGFAWFAASGDGRGNLGLMGNYTNGTFYSMPYTYSSGPSAGTKARVRLSLGMNEQQNLGYPTHYLTWERTGLSGTLTFEHQWAGSGITEVTNGTIWAGNNEEGFAGSSDPEYSASQARQMTRVNTKIGGAERIYNVDAADPQLNIVNTNYRLVGTGASKRLRITFNITTNSTWPNGTPLMVAQYHNKYAHTPLTLSTLENPSDGGILRYNSKYIRLVADSGTNFTVDWDYLSDGIDVTQGLVTLAPFVTATGVV